MTGARLVVRGSAAASDRDVDHAVAGQVTECAHARGIGNVDEERRGEGSRSGVEQERESRPVPRADDHVDVEIAVRVARRHLDLSS
jgi:hypothetical protein